MERRDFLSKASLATAYGILITQMKGGIKMATASETNPVSAADSTWRGVQTIMGYSDNELEIFKNQPRTIKIVSRLSGLKEASVIFEVKKVHGCIAGHKKGDFFVFPNAGSMDLQNSSPQLCPFLMPPMTRIMWVLQERVWEDLDPLPLYASGQCDDVGLDCDGWGRVLVEARIMKPDEVKSLEKK